MSGIWHGILGGGAGQLGVMIFFALSSFLMSHLYYQPTPWTRAELREFALRRAFRILPLFFLAVAVSYSLLRLGVVEGFGISSPTALILNATFIRGDSVLWTIGPELLFYAAFAAFMLMPAQGRQHMLMGAMMFYVLLSESLRLPPVGVNIIDHLDSYEFFLIGPVVYLALQKFAPPPRRVSDLLAICLPLILLLHIPPIHYRVFGFTLPNSGWNSIQVAILIGAVLYGTLRFRLISGLLATGPARYLGRISFSMYLGHLFVLQGLEKAGLVAPSLWSFALALALVLVVSAALHEGFERPVQKRLLAAFLTSGAKPAPRQALAS
jgi:peptidoglycan/LPS O-acetylase OafA/YrhL